MKSFMKRREQRPAVTDEHKSGEGHLASDDRPASASAGDLVRSAIISKLMSAAVVAALVAGPVALLVALGSGGAPASPTSASHRDPAAVRQAGAEDYAIRVVVAWAASTADDSDRLRELMPGAASTTNQTPMRISDPRVAHISHRGRTWTVIVAGTVGGRTRYFQVPVAYEGRALAALAWPAPVTAPTVVKAPGANYPVSVGLTTPLASSVSQFLEAYLTGTGDLSRYVSPGRRIDPVSPAVGTAISLDELNAQPADGSDLDGTPASGERVRVFAAATVTLSATQELQTNYALTLKARDGRWEIEKVDPAPAVLNKSPENTSGSSSTSSTTPTTPEGE